MLGVDHALERSLEVVGMCALQGLPKRSFIDFKVLIHSMNLRIAYHVLADEVAPARVYSMDENRAVWHASKLLPRHAIFGGKTSRSLTSLEPSLSRQAEAEAAGHLFTFHWCVPSTLIQWAEEIVMPDFPHTCALEKVSPEETELAQHAHHVIAAPFMTQFELQSPCVSAAGMPNGFGPCFQPA